jgi:4-hydroxy-2-oxoheptanedioate aldolase
VLDELEAIADEDVDVLMPGPGDLALGFGVPGRLDHPLVRNAVDRIAEATRAPGAPALMAFVEDVAEVPALWEAGVRLFIAAIDLALLRRGYSALLDAVSSGWSTGSSASITRSRA